MRYRKRAIDFSLPSSGRETFVRRLLPEGLASVNAREWRKRLREKLTAPETWQTLWQIFEGMPYQPAFPDGKLGPVQTPTVSERLAAFTLLRDAGLGKPVPETEIAHAEAAQGALNALSDADLAQLAREFLENGAGAGSLPATVDGEIVTVTQTSDANRAPKANDGPPVGPRGGGGGESRSTPGREGGAESAIATSQPRQFFGKCRQTPTSRCDLDKLEAELNAEDDEA